MQNKKRILFLTESHKLASGFGTYAKEVVKRIHETNKYEVGQIACYSKPSDFNDTDWPIYGIAPEANEKDYFQMHKQPPVQWGILRFGQICSHFKPDIVVTYRDPWMDAYIADSPLLPFFHWVWMPTIDSEPQKNEWLYWFNRCDGLMAYSEYGIRTLHNQTNGRLKVSDCASPAIDPVKFDIIPNKKAHKEKFGLDPDSFIVGTVMRNQKRKMFPDLIRSFKEFLTKAPPHIANKSLLYLHTSYPEKMGWNITSLMHEFGLGGKLITTYICKNCKKYFCAHYRDAITVCNHCGRCSAVMPGVGHGIEHDELVNIYNLMDLYVQYAICEGFGMPQVEAAACGVPIASVDYSAMEDVVNFSNGYKIEPRLYREMETNADRSGANNERLVEIFMSCSSQNEQQKKRHRLETRKGCIQRYTWDNAAKAWENYFDKVELKGMQGKWDSPMTMKSIPDSIPKGMNNQQFCEWLCTSVLQDQYHAFNHKMLTMLRDLNFGAKVDHGLDPCTPESLFKEVHGLASRRLSEESFRCRTDKNNVPDFIRQAHIRMKK